MDHEILACTEGSLEPRQVILTACRDYNANILILGCKGVSDLEGLELGSVSDYCCKRAPCPVVLVPLSDQESVSSDSASGAHECHQYQHRFSVVGPIKNEQEDVGDGANQDFLEGFEGFGVTSDACGIEIGVLDGKDAM
jgi:hypothetical protein